MRLCIWILVFMVGSTIGDDDSLRSALNAVNRRQRSYPEEFALDEHEQPDSMSSLEFDDTDEERRNVDLEKALLDYLDERDNSDEPKERSSPFRERLKQDAGRQTDRPNKQEQVLYEHTVPYQGYDGTIPLAASGQERMEEMYDKYRGYYPSAAYTEDSPSSIYNMKKRSYYPSMRWESVGMKKRSRAFQPDGPRESLYLLNYAPRDEIFNRLQEDEATSPEASYQWGPLSTSYNQYQRQADKKWDNERYMNKRFPVSKRSGPSSYYPDFRTPAEQFTHQYKRSSLSRLDSLPKTDPDVAKDLTHLFNPKDKLITRKVKKTAGKPETPIKSVKKPTHTTSDGAPLKPTVNKKQLNGSKEFIPVGNVAEKPLQIKKKSVDWSDYFGLDRRKKTDDKLNNDWLMERYYTAMAKRGDPTEERYSSTSGSSLDVNKLSDMDSKLKGMEESLVDDTLKYTGAHQGVTDTKEMQKIKDRIISRLAAAYSLEKMRHALAEYKKTVEHDRKLKQTEEQQQKVEQSKRASMARKQAIDPDHQRNIPEDNNIKCQDGAEDCAEQNYKSTSRLLVLDDPQEKSGCPPIEKACVQIAAVFGRYAELFQLACEMHQMCLLCNDNNWFGPTRQCKMLYLAKADQICEEDMVCRDMAINSIHYLQDVSRTLSVSRPDGIGGACPSIACPDH